MDFSSLVLIERDNEGKFLKEHGITITKKETL